MIKLNKILCIFILTLVCSIAMGQNKYQENLEAAQKGEASAQYSLGMAYSQGDGVEKNMNEAISWMLKAANQDYSPALLALGVFYVQGTGIGTNDWEAVKWLKRLVDKKEDDAVYARGLYLLGLCELNGRGIQKNESDAFNHFLRSSTNKISYDKSYYRLGLCYLNGQGTSVNLDKAVEWLSKAVEAKDENAVQWLEIAQKRRDEKQITSTPEIQRPQKHNLDNDTQRKVIEQVQTYCKLMKDFSADKEKIDLMEDIFDICENNNVSIFNDLAVASTTNISDNSMPLQHYMMLLTDKYDNKVKTSYSGFEYLEAIVQPSPMKDFDATTYAVVKVDKNVNVEGKKTLHHLKITVNTSTMKVSSTTSEDYEDPQGVYLEALKQFNEEQYQKAIPLFEKVSVLTRFSGRYRAMSMLGWIYADQKEYPKAYKLLEESSQADPLGGVILASKILLNDKAPMKLINYAEGINMLSKIGDARDKDFPAMHLIAYSTIVDVYFKRSHGISQISFIPNELFDKMETCLIKDAHSTDPFKMRGYYLRFATSSDNDSQTALSNITKAKDLLNKSQLGKEEQEFWEPLILHGYWDVLMKNGDNDKAAAILKELAAKPYAAIIIAENAVKSQFYEFALKFFMRAAVSGNPFATYIVSLSKLPPGLMDTSYFLSLFRISDVKYWAAFIMYLDELAEKEKDTRTFEEYLKWNQKAIDMGEVLAMEDRAYFEAKGVLPYISQNIPHAIELACKAACIGIRLKSKRLFIISEIAQSYIKSKQIPFENSEIYKTLNLLDEQGNGAASYLLWNHYYDYNNQDKASHYFENSLNAHFFHAMLIYAYMLTDEGKYDEAFASFRQLAMYPKSTAFKGLGYIEQKYRRNYVEARKYYSQGMDDNDYACYESMSDLCKMGLGGEKDLLRAKELITKAIDLYKLDINYISDEISPDEKLKELMDKKEEIDLLISNTPDIADNMPTIQRLNEILNTSLSEDKRIALSNTLLKKFFASPKSIVKTIGVNDKTVVSTDTAEDFLLHLATIKTDKRIVEISSKKHNNKYIELTIQMK